jgi:predicted small secreted protein
MDCKVPVIYLLIVLSVLLNGCNTAKGFGKDLESLGLIIQEKMSPSINVEGYGYDGSTTEQSGRYKEEEAYGQDTLDWSQPIDTSVNKDVLDDG